MSSNMPYSFCDSLLFLQLMWRRYGLVKFPIQTAPHYRHGDDGLGIVQRFALRQEALGPSADIYRDDIVQLPWHFGLSYEGEAEQRDVLQL
jgi:hypothetical protein